MKRYLTVPEVADYFSVGRSTVYEWIKDGKLAVWHPDGLVGTKGLRILGQSIKEFEVSGTIAPDRFRE